MTEIVYDSLPYLDYEYNEIKDKVQNMLKKEMDQITSKDFTTHIPNLSLFKNSILLTNEMERIKRGEKLEAIDLSRYNPTSTFKNKKQEQQDLNKLHIIESIIDNRLLNVELMKKFGNNSWKSNNYELKGLLFHTKTHLDTTIEIISETNKKRKFDQIKFGKLLRENEREWVKLINSNFQFEMANDHLEKELKKKYAKK